MRISSSKTDSLSKPSKKLLITILWDTTLDDCECICSLNGCSPLTILFGGLFPAQSQNETAERVQILVGLSKFAPLHSSNSDLKRSLKSHLAAGILQFITFQRLKLTHTCLHEYRKIEPEEIKEIQYEVKSMIWILGRY